MATKAQVEALIAELHTGLMDEDEFNRRADGIGLTEAQCEQLAWGSIDDVKGLED